MDKYSLISKALEAANKVFEIYPEDLTDDARERLHELVGDEVAIGPLAIIEFHDEDITILL